jgi:iron(III) transport system substrate-binding protein
MARSRGVSAPALAGLGVVLLVMACAPAPAAAPRPTVVSTAAPLAAQPSAEQAAAPTAPIAEPESLDALYARAQQEGGTVVCYCAIAQQAADRIFAAFAQRFPGVRVDHVDATSEALATRAVAEARGGRALGDVFSTEVEVLTRLNGQRLLRQEVPPEASEYLPELRGPYWVATDVIFITAAWNTSQVAPEEEPRQFEDFAHPRWKNRLIAEPRDTELLIGLARHKYRDDARAAELLRQIAANDVEFHRGHSDLTELLVAGHAAACITCYAHHYPPRMRRGAPVNFLQSEAIGFLRGISVFQDAPHPNAARLLARWAITAEGQRAVAEAGLAPAHPGVEPVEAIRPRALYPIGADDLAARARYESQWKEIFQLR